jgi:hypothetical protein
VIAWILLVATAALGGCQHTPPDRRAQSDQLVEQVRALPGVRSASGDVAASVARNDVHFWLAVDVADNATADQVAAIAKSYLDHVSAVGYSGYQTELDIRCGENVFAVDGGRKPLQDIGQTVVQARDWIALRGQFPGATVTVRADPEIGTITLPDPADYRDVATASAVLSSRFPQLTDGNWTINASTLHPATLTSSKRMPTAAELDVWTKINADQTIPHIDAMTINAPLTAPLWISEKTISRDPAAALTLAAGHLPIVATLPAPVLYTATDKLQAHRNYDGHITGPVAVTTGGCTPRNYPFGQAEKKLIDTYERCPVA